MWFIPLIIIVGFVYLSSMQGITCCNSGSLFALVKAMAKKRKFTINGFVKYTKYIDYAKKGNDYYTDRPPGVSFAALPIYLLKGNPTLVSVISGTLSAALVYLITFHLVDNSLIAFFTALIFAFCTINWRYSTLFLIHALSTFLVLLSVYLIFLDYSFFWIGLLFGMATIVEYTSFVLFSGMILSRLILVDFLTIPPLFLGYTIGVLPLLIYNAKCFGSPFTTSYKYGMGFKWSNSPKTTFVTPLFKGMMGLLFFMSKKKMIKLAGGILTISPILVFGIIGYFYLPYEILILFLSLSLPLFLLISKHKTWWAGGAGDYRYLSLIIPYITIPIGLSIKNINFLLPVIIFLALMSLMMMLSRMVIYTITPEDFNKIEPNLFKKIKKKNFGLLELIKPKYFFRVLSLVFVTIFIRKIHLEKD